MRDRSNAERTWVGFEVGGVAYALPIQHIREIIRPLPMQVLPHSSETVIGVIDHRGDVVPIVDLRLRFRAKGSAPASLTRWLIGLAVDRVIEVFALNEAEARPVPDLGQGQEVHGITAAYSHAGRLVFTLDVQRITQTGDGPFGLDALTPGAEGT
jgi:purine-binding chemotaxis protein CheW